MTRSNSDIVINVSQSGAGDEGIALEGAVKAGGQLFRLCLLAIVLWCQLCAAVHASVTREQLRVPPNDTIQMLTLNDGSRVSGRITKVEETTIEFTSHMGVLSLPISNIMAIDEVPSGSIRNGQYWFPNPNKTHLFLSPTGRMLEAGKGYFSDAYIFFPSVSLGITNHFSMSAGMSVLPGLHFSEQLYFFVPRVGYQVSKQVSLATSLLVVQVPQTDVAGILFGSCSVGSDDNSLTFGLGEGFVGGHWASRPAVLAGGQWRFARRISFVSENWIFPGVENLLVSYGLRFFGEKVSVDVAFFNLTGESFWFPGLLYLDFSWNF